VTRPLIVAGVEIAPASGFPLLRSGGNGRAQRRRRRARRMPTMRANRAKMKRAGADLPGQPQQGAIGSSAGRDESRGLADAEPARRRGVARGTQRLQARAETSACPA
jgi:hypothetical protein